MYIIASYKTTAIMNIRYSEDGITWGSTDIATGSYPYRGGVVFGNGVYVISMGDKMAYSYDGKSWTSYDSPVDNISNIIRSNLFFCNGRFILQMAYTRYGISCYLLASSTDGINWTIHDKSSNVTHQTYKIIYCNYRGSNRYVALTGNAVAYLYYSSNLETWTQDYFEDYTVIDIFATDNFTGAVGYGYVNSSYKIIYRFPTSSVSSESIKLNEMGYYITSVSATVYNYDKDTIYFRTDAGMVEWTVGSDANLSVTLSSCTSELSNTYYPYGWVYGGNDTYVFVNSSDRYICYSNDGLATITKTDIQLASSSVKACHGVERPRG